MGYAFCVHGNTGWRDIRRRIIVYSPALMPSLHVLDWVPVRLAGVVYALIGHGGESVTVRFCFAG